MNPLNLSRALTAAALMLTAGPVAAYERSTTSEDDPLEWNQRIIHYALHSAGSDDIPLETLETEVALSFQPWAEQPCASLEFIYDGLKSEGADPEDIGYDLNGPNQNIIVFRETRDGWQILEPGNRRREPTVIAVTIVTFCEGAGGQCDLPGEILDADIEVNGAFFRFSTEDNPPTARFDLRNTLTHEVGHLLGFDHTPDTEATMFPSAPIGETRKRTLAPDDINALCDVYARIYDERKSTDDDDCSTTPGRPRSAAPALLLLAGLAALSGRHRRRRSHANRT